MKQFLIALFVILIACIFGAKSSYADGGIVINEIMVHPQAGNDWVELFNTGSSPINLSGMTLKDTGASPMKMLSGMIESGGFVTFDVSNRLNNGGDTLQLVDASGTVIDSFTYSTDPGLNISLARSPNGTGGFISTDQPTKNSFNGQVSASSTPAPTNIPTPTPQVPTSSNPPVGGQIQINGISLSEYLPNPKTGEDEWVELYNDSSNEVNLAGWKIDDAEYGSSPFTIPAEGNAAFIPPKSYKVYIMTSSRFNNSGDSIRLLRPDSSLVEETSYNSSSEGIALAKDSNGHWQETSQATPGSANVINTPKNTTSSTSNSSTQAQSGLNIASPKATKSSVLAASTEAKSTRVLTYAGVPKSTVLPESPQPLPSLQEYATPTAMQASDVLTKESYTMYSPVRYVVAGILMVFLLTGLGVYKYYLIWKQKQLSNDAS